jgi:hypothetical protein
MRVNSSGPYGTPLDYYRPVGFTLVQETLLRVVTLIPLTIILTSFYNRSSRSIQPTAIFHASMNTFPIRAPVLHARVGNVFFFAAYAVIAARMWSRAPNAEPRSTVAGSWRP